MLPAFLRLAKSTVYTRTQTTENTGDGLLYLELRKKVTVTNSRMKHFYIIKLLTQNFIPPSPPPGPQIAAAGCWNETATIFVNKTKLFRQTNPTAICPRTAAVKRIEYLCMSYVSTGRDSSVSTATRYGLEGPGIESRWGRYFPHLSRPVLGPTQPPVKWVPGLSRE
jgi:hypothetical protein